MLASLIKLSSILKPYLVETLLTVIIQRRFNNVSALKLAVICLSRTQLKVRISYVIQMCILILSPSLSLSIAICKISFSIHISTSFAPTTLLRYYSSGMLLLNSYTACSIYIRRIRAKPRMLNLLFVFIAAHCRYQTSASCPSYSFLKPNESYQLHPFSAIGRSYPVRLLKVRWRHFNL